MICQLCRKNEATTFVKTVVNGQLSQLCLCESCARERGIGAIFGGVDIGDFLGGLFMNQPAQEAVKRCGDCGVSYEEIVKSGKVGCPACYEVFKDQMASMIKRVHGSTVHKGKRPGGSALRVTEESNEIMPVNLLEEKQKQLSEAIAEQAFERAAILRDEIREMGTNE